MFELTRFVEVTLLVSFNGKVAIEMWKQGIYCTFILKRLKRKVENRNGGTLSCSGIIHLPGLSSKTFKMNIQRKSV